MEKLTEQIKESLAGERLASFLPLVKELHEDYDPTAIAAATLQILYDRDCPSWLQQDWDVPPPATPKPYIKKKVKEDVLNMVVVVLIASIVKINTKVNLNVVITAQ